MKGRYKMGEIMREKRTEIKTNSLQEIEAACRSAIACLDDWIQTTEFGAVHRRDKQAREMLEMALDRIEEVQG